MIRQNSSPSSQPGAHEAFCVVLAADERDGRLPRCLDSIARHAEDARVETVEPTTAAINRALAALAPADVLLLSEPCLLTDGAGARLREAAYADTNTASASSFVDAGGPLALGGDQPNAADELAAHMAASSLALRPRLGRIVGPCVYLRRDALELVGALDASLELVGALEIDLAQRCLLIGLAHVAADDALVIRIAPESPRAGRDCGLVRKRYPYLEAPVPAQPADPEPRPPAWTAVAASQALPRALAAARRARAPLGVTIDGRSLGSVLTGTQRHVLELIRALAGSETLGLRVLVSTDAGAAVRAELAALPGVELLSVERISRDTTRSAIFHRPQQVFETEDLRIALRLGERIVLSQLDLIAYRNPSYHADAAAWRRHRRVTRQSLAAADRVIVFSRHTREELLSDEMIEGGRVCIIPPGLDHATPSDASNTADDAAPGELAAALGAHRFLLCLGTDFGHKNRTFALRMFEAMRGLHGWDGRLVFAGTHIPHGSSRASELALLERSPALRERLIELGAVDEHTKNWLVDHASAILYPSVYEGFGLVPLEAALRGVPTLFAPQASLADVLPAETATIVPWDVERSAERAAALLGDAGRRQAQLDALREVAASLTWQATAQATLEVYGETIVAPMREAAAMSRDELRRERELRALVEAQDALVAQLTEERRHAQKMYDDLNREAGFALGLIGPRGSLPEDAQRALLALSAAPRLSRPLFGALARLFRVGRALARGRSRVARDRAG
ncbi:MAG TPA: glycosyltransferase [Solirubrobacteraceae bacterium]|nr:glycosyltransferase [Solirubrobacteraceae bacterium]